MWGFQTEISQVSKFTALHVMAPFTSANRSRRGPPTNCSWVVGASLKISGSGILVLFKSEFR